MAKLKYDRPINIGLGKNKYVTVPEGEVWKVSTRQSVNAFATNLYGGGYTFPTDGAATCVSGIAFKHVEE